MFFRRPGEAQPCGMFSIGHLILLTITVISIMIALHFTKKRTKQDVQRIIKNVTIVLWVLEIIKIIFNLAIGNANNPGSYIPLYYCSLTLYAGIFSSCCKGTLKRIGDVFLATGSIVGGVCFLLCPNTSLTIYPMLHYISIQSFIFHGVMTYLGILVATSNYVEISLKDIKYYAGLILAISTVAYIFNYFFDCNLMFISKNFPGTPIEIAYWLTGPLFPVFMVALQATAPFYLVYAIRKSLSMKYQHTDQALEKTI